MLRDGDALRAIVNDLAALLGGEQIDVIVGIESRGFVLAPLIARELGVGFSPIRKNDALFPGDTIGRETASDYRGNGNTLRLRADHFQAGQLVALIDDWIETGSQASTAAQLITDVGATLGVIAVIIDEATDEVKSSLPPIRALVHGNELP